MINPGTEGATPGLFIFTINARLSAIKLLSNSSQYCKLFCTTCFPQCNRQKCQNKILPHRRLPLPLPPLILPLFLPLTLLLLLPLLWHHLQWHPLRQKHYATSP